jgi:hypothetical protein
VVQNKLLNVIFIEKDDVLTPAKTYQNVPFCANITHNPIEPMFYLDVTKDHWV